MIKSKGVRDLEDLEVVFKALASESRRRILIVLNARGVYFKMQVLWRFINKGGSGFTDRVPDACIKSLVCGFPGLNKNQKRKEKYNETSNSCRNVPDKRG
jgi:hypothetical protein